MKKILMIIVAVMAMAIGGAGCCNAKSGEGKKVKTTIYIYGVAFNPTDSVVYMTDELMLEAELSKKNGFLNHRHELSQQLKNHMAEKGIKNLTVAISYAKNLKAIDKKFNKQKAHLKKQGYLIKSVDQTEFRFTAIISEEE